MTNSPQQPPAGWYPDPAGSGGERFWDGVAWSQSTRDKAAPQPAPDAPELFPDVVFVPLVGFTADGHRLGQGGGHYDRWLAATPSVLPLGLAWDCQLREELPTEPHDCRLRGVITPTRFYGDV